MATQTHHFNRAVALMYRVASFRFSVEGLLIVSGDCDLKGAVPIVLIEPVV